MAGGKGVIMFIIMYVLVAVLISSIFYYVADHSRDELFQILGWFHGWDTVVFICIGLGLIWPLVIIEFVRRVIVKLATKA